MPIDDVPQIRTIDPTQVAKLVDDGALLIDVREQHEWDLARIEGAQLKPLSQANDWYQDLPTDRDIVFYCHSGQRSGQIVEALMQRAGLTNVINMSGGLLAWAENDLPIEE